MMMDTIIVRGILVNKIQPQGKDEHLRYLELLS